MSKVNESRLSPFETYIFLVLGLYAHFYKNPVHAPDSGYESLRSRGSLLLVQEFLRSDEVVHKNSLVQDF